MAGSILGPDQVIKVNGSYAAIVAHIRALFAGDKTPVGLMRIHFLTEFLDTTELSRIFMGLSFLSPAEKRALVRTAIFEVLLNPEAAFVVPAETVVDTAALKKAGAVELKPFTPAQFRLNTATTEALKEVKSNELAKGAAPVPVVPAVLTRVQDALEQGKAEAKEQQAEMEAAVTEIRTTEAKDVK